MPGPNCKLVEHKIPLKLGYRSYKQPLRQFAAEVMSTIEEKIEMLLLVDFIEITVYTVRLSNVYTNYRNLNSISPKDEYPMHVVDLLMDSSTSNEVMTFVEEMWHI